MERTLDRGNRFFLGGGVVGITLQNQFKQGLGHCKKKSREEKCQSQNKIRK